MKILFWVSAGALVYHYFGYPLLIGVLSKLRKTVAYSPSIYPTVTLLISVFNEEEVLPQRLENCLALDYPRDKLRILVVSDGSTDDTHRIVREFGCRGIDLAVVEGRVGKIEALNRVIPRLDGEIIVFTDANSMLHPSAIKNLVLPFSDSGVGAVCGELRLTGSPGAEGVYWRYEKAIKQFESNVSSMTVLNGALYALRRELHRPMNPLAPNDFQHPLQVVLQGYRSVYQPLALAFEPGGADAALEAKRRVRIISRSWRGLLSHAQALNPFKTGFFSFQLLSHKLLRWLGPLFMAAAFGANLALAESAFYRVILLLQGAFYGMAALGFFLDRLKVRSPLTYLPYYFCLINWAALKGLVRVILGRESATWTPTTSSYQKTG